MEWSEELRGTYHILSLSYWLGSMEVDVIVNSATLMALNVIHVLVQCTGVVLLWCWFVKQCLVLRGFWWAWLLFWLYVLTVHCFCSCFYIHTISVYTPAMIGGCCVRACVSTVRSLFLMVSERRRDVCVEPRSCSANVVMIHVKSTSPCFLPYYVLASPT